jgi:hypothetical protein
MDENSNKSTVSVAIATLSGEEDIGPALETNPFYLGNNIRLCKECNNCVKVTIRCQVSALRNG